MSPRSNPKPNLLTQSLLPPHSNFLPLPISSLLPLRRLSPVPVFPLLFFPSPPFFFPFPLPPPLDMLLIMCSKRRLLDFECLEIFIWRMWVVALIYFECWHSQRGEEKGEEGETYRRFETGYWYFCLMYLCSLNGQL